MSSDRILATYSKVRFMYVLPDGIDLKSKDVRYYIKYNTLYIETRDGRSFEITGELDDDLKWPDEIEDKNGDALEAYDDGEAYDTFEERDKKYAETDVGAYADEYYEPLSESEESTEEETTEEEVIEKMAEEILNIQRGK